VAIGHGALNAEAIALLNDGYGVRLLNDSEGRTVLYIDRSRFQHGSEFRNSMLQLVLYMFCVILEEVSSQKKGLVIVVNGRVRRSLLLDCSWKYSITAYCLPTMLTLCCVI
jgi:hypothetical protein